MKWLMSRLKEPSTWAGLAVLAPSAVQAAAGGLTPQAVAQIAGGLAAVLIKEKGAPQ